MLETKQDTPGTVARESSRNRRKFGAILLGLALAALGASVWHFKATGQPPFLHRENVWSIAIYEGPSPLQLAPTNADNTPVLTAADVKDVPALFVADPFMVEHDGKWYMFLEVLNSDTYQGDIGLATSTDGGAHWEYDRIVLDEPGHLSYPSVFQWEGTWYMLPQSSDGVHLYVAESFPTKWRRTYTILSGGDLADPTMFRHDETWWMFVGRSGTHDRLRLFFADDFMGQWTEHPKSPVVESNADIARPGGPVASLNGQLIRLGQDCSPKYGNQLRGFMISSLTRHEYAEKPVDSELVLRAGSHAWNANGMHHSDAHQLQDGSWRAVVDGHKKTWILRSTP